MHVICLNKIIFCISLLAANTLLFNTTGKLLDEKDLTSKVNHVRKSLRMLHFNITYFHSVISVAFLKKPGYWITSSSM